MALEGNVKVPGAGPVPKKAAAAGLIIVGTLIGVYYYRKRKSAAAPAATSTDQYPPDGTTGNPSDPYSTDPATGQTYGNEAVGSGGTFGAFSAPSPDTGGPSTTPSPGPYLVPGGPPFASNSAWADWVVQELQAQNPATNAGALTSAVGLYLEGQPLSATQRTLVFEARAIAGDPPVAGAGGYPPNMRGDGSKGGKTVAHNPVSGLRVTHRYTQADVHWDKAAHATSYRVILKRGQTRAQTHQVGQGDTHITLHNLRKATKYEVSVLALPTDSAGYSHEAHASFTTA